MNPIELGARDLLILARLRLVASAFLLILATTEAAESRRLRVWWIAIVVCILVCTVLALRRVIELDRRVVAARELAVALQVGTESDIEIAWMNLLYLQDPATQEGDLAVRRHSPFRQLHRDRPRLARVLRLGHHW